jgi:uncharacterized protein YlzI (FlbEa/FlbD family)
VSKFIQLTLQASELWYVNAANIVAISGKDDDDNATITTTDGSSVKVRESVEVVWSKIPAELR